MTYKYCFYYDLFYSPDPYSGILKITESPLYFNLKEWKGAEGVPVLINSMLYNTDINTVCTELKRILDGEWPNERAPSFSPSIEGPHLIDGSMMYDCYVTKEETTYHVIEYRTRQDFTRKQIAVMPTNELLEALETFKEYKKNILSTMPRIIFHDFGYRAHYSQSDGISEEMYLEYFKVTPIQYRTLDTLKYTFFSSYPDLTIDRKLQYGVLHHHLIVSCPYEYFGLLMFLNSEKLKEIIEQLEKLQESDDTALYQFEEVKFNFIANKTTVTIKKKIDILNYNGPNTQIAPMIEVLQMLKDFWAYVESQKDMPLHTDKDKLLVGSYVEYASFW